MSAEHLDQLFGLHGKVALVTGASSGLGVEFAQGLAMAGADVAVVARRLERLQAVAKQLEAFGVRAHAVQADLRDEAQIDAALQQAQETLGPIDILVNNAGIAPVSRAERHTLDRWQQALDINLNGGISVLSKSRAADDRTRAGRTYHQHLLGSGRRGQCGPQNRWLCCH